MFNVSNTYGVTMDTKCSSTISVHMKDGKIEFIPTTNSLCVHHLDTLQDIPSMWLILTTVSEKAQSYTKTGLQTSNDGTKLQNIITKADIQAAEDIFGPNLGLLKGKTECF
jgi:hypothetical protein